jgi:hypothetical protein
MNALARLATALASMVKNAMLHRLQAIITLEGSRVDDVARQIFRTYASALLARTTSR